MPRFVLLLAVVAALIVTPRNARAYPWMIRHDYTACAQCHVDPSGGGPLTAYGRAMGEVVLKTHYGAVSADGEEDPGAGAKFLWGTLPLPEALDLGGSFRVMSLNRATGGEAATHDLIYMQSDLTATVQASRWVLSGSIGWEPKGGLFAALTRTEDTNIVSRFHWLGYHLDENGKMLFRVGRMNLPYGIRDVLHTLAVRTTTRTNIDDQQQHGFAFSYSGENLRAEIMGILGNYQVHPDDYRERGYSGYFEWAPATNFALGVSSRIAHVDLDPQYAKPMWRHAHGVFGRWALPWRPLVLMGEADYVVDSIKDFPRNQGIEAMLQADLEVVQGLHYQVTGEAGDFGPHDLPMTYGVWASFAWFFASHMDVRLDAIYESLGSLGGRTPAELLLIQGHLYL
jgi:hypothetical protein